MCVGGAPRLPGDWEAQMMGMGNMITAWRSMGNHM